MDGWTDERKVVIGQMGKKWYDENCGSYRRDGKGIGFRPGGRERKERKEGTIFRQLFLLFDKTVISGND